MHEGNYHHEEVVEIMVSPPGWGLKWGNIIIGFIVLLIFGFAYFFSYPDTLKLPIDLSSTTSIITVRPPAVNYGIETFLVKNGDVVKPGTPLVAWYDQYRSNFGEISKLEQILLSYNTSELENASVPNLQTGLKTIDEHKLGALNAAWQSLVGIDPKSTAQFTKQVQQTLSAISQWRTQWLTTAAAGGTVTLNNLAPQLNISVDTRKPVLYLQPSNAHYIAHGVVSNKQYGNVKIGQPAYVGINELSGKKVQGIVISISPIANQTMHDIYIQLNQMPGLNITFTGDAVIVLHNRTLLQRLFNINN